MTLTIAILYLVCVMVHVIAWFAKGDTGTTVVAVSNLVGLVLGATLAISVLA